MCARNEPVYQAIWADNIDFDQVLISPTMINDHMPDKVMEALEKVMYTTICEFHIWADENVYSQRCLVTFFVNDSFIDLLLF